MSDTYQRIKRSHLLTDTNLAIAGSVTETLPATITIDENNYLNSRIGNSGRLPTAGCCLRFDANNPSIYIETIIPSSTVNNFDIIIKGEGTKELLKVDTSTDFIRFVLTKTPASNEYFDLSYIVFIGKTSQKIEHLFECEERVAIFVLYDACDQYGGFASLKSVSSISSLRIASPAKEFISQYDPNSCLKNSLTVGPHCFVRVPTWTQLTEINLPVSFCITYDVESWEGIGSGANQGIAFFDSYAYNWTDNFAYGFLCMYNTDYGGCLSCAIAVKNTVPETQRFAFESRRPLPTGKHTVVITLNSMLSSGAGRPSNPKIYIDGVAVPTNTTAVGLSEDSLNISSGLELAIGSWYNYAPGIGTSFKGPLIPVILSRPCILNFDMSDANAAYTVSDYINEVTPPLDDCLIYLDNVGFNSWLDKSAQAHTTSYYNAGVEVENRQLPNKNYGMWINAVGGGNCGYYCGFSENSGCDYQYNDINGDPHTGWDGAIVNYTNSGTAYQVTMGGRGTVADGDTPLKTLTTTPNASYINPYTGLTDYCYLSGGLPTLADSSRPVMCCENRDLSQDTDKPDCIKYAINYSQFQSPATNWYKFAFGASLGLRIYNFLNSYSYPINVNGYLKYRYSFWIRRLSGFTLPDTASSIAKIGIGLTAVAEANWNLSLYPYDKWIYLTGEFYGTPRVEYYWQLSPSIAAWYHNNDSSTWTTNEPIAAMANPKVELVAAYDPSDHTKLWDIPEEAYVGLTPRRIM